ncbi:MAG TPA: hypothetical protein VGX92_20705 [Pyrinomonadaceae bacterium]|jgi:hypothetical protein|nr:hypothetical protein [Pyrinomonadaceae bacterium]
MNILNSLKDLVRGSADISARLAATETRLESLKLLTARAIINQLREHGIYDDIHETEFKVFSQFGDDGIIQYLINNTEIEERAFIEFGVENYTESNTRFLLINNNWKGLVIDGSSAHIEYIKSDSIYWRHELTAVHSFIDKENINEIIAGQGFTGALGILSIDIDGNDYWIWECIVGVEPVVVIIEYNSVFGVNHAITIPYDPTFNRTKAHPSNLYWGASLKAMCRLAEKKGYAFVGSNSSGNNAYFVRKDKLGGIHALSPESGYVKSRFRESLDEQGRLTYLSDTERLKAIEEMTVYDLERGALVKIKSLYDGQEARS